MSVISESKIKADDTIRAQCFHPSGTFVEFKKEEIEQSIPDRFEQMVQMYPNRHAVKTKTCAFTYEQLNQAANRVAHAILAKRDEGKEPVALLFEQGASVIAAILGVLKAGKIYAHLDPLYPQTRIKSMLEDSQAGLIVTNHKNLALTSELGQKGLQIINIDELDSSICTENPGLALSPDALISIFYTSGSTGQPKGVVKNHRNLLHIVRIYTNTLHICAEDRQTLFHSSSFGVSLKNIFITLLNGGVLFPIDLKREGVVNLANWLFQEEITIYSSVPTAFRQLIGTLTGEEEFSKLRIIHLGGEPVTKKDVELCRQYFSPECLFINVLALTETDLVRWYFINKTTPVTGSAVPVGHAVEDTEILLLDEAGERVGFNEIAEIYVKSSYLSPGYWRKPALTKASFLPDPEGGEKRIYRTGDLGRMLPDGCLEYIGRKDFQLKVRGHRIEVAEIEMALLDLDTVKGAVVVAQEDVTGNKRLVVYIVPTGKPVPTVSKLRGFLKEKLPDYMIPSAFVMLDALPLTPTGKVDRKALPVPDQSRPDLEEGFVAPRTPVEKAVAGIWAEVLGVQQVGIHDNFFDLGGHSLLATQVISRVRAAFQIELPLRNLFEKPTVEELAAVITQNQAKKVGPEELARVLAELESLSDEEAQRRLGKKSASSQ